MEAGHLRENPQTPQQQETPQAITEWVQAATDMHPACPNKKQNHLQNSLLRRTQFWVRKTFSTGFAQKGLPSIPRKQALHRPYTHTHKVNHM